MRLMRLIQYSYITVPGYVKQHVTDNPWEKMFYSEWSPSRDTILNSDSLSRGTNHTAQQPRHIKMLSYFVRIVASPSHSQPNKRQTPVSKFIYKHKYIIYKQIYTGRPKRVNSSERHHWHAAQAQVTCLKIACTNKNGNKHKTNIDRQATRDETCFIQNVLIFFSARAPAARVFCFHTVSLSQSLSELISVSQRCSVLVFSVTVQFSSVFSFQCLSVRRRVACCVLRVVCCVLVCVCVLMEVCESVGGVRRFLRLVSY